MKEKYFKHDIYINKGKTIYKALQLKKPGILSCFGFCYKNVYKLMDDVNSKYKNRVNNTMHSVKSDIVQLGGSFLINNKGEIILEHVDSFAGDHVKEEDIIDAVKNYLVKPNKE
jgi:hypothetical protein